MLTSFLQADVADGVLEKYKNRIFVNTGIRSCVAIARALNADFIEIYALENDKVLVEHSKYVIPIYINEKPRKLKNYQVFHGDSKTDLKKLIDAIPESITFLLSSFLPDIDHPEQINNVLYELEQIKDHPIKTHTILIEYIQYAGSSLFDHVTLEEIKTKILEINPLYQFTFEKGGHLEKEENSILVAYLRR